MVSIYQAKPAFQAVLRPVANVLAKRGVTANQVTATAALVSVATGGALFVSGGDPLVLWLLPVVLLVRMAMNAVDGLIAREHNQTSSFGACLNEICDLVSDLAFVLPFAFVGPFGVASVLAFAGLLMLSEFAGLLGPLCGTRRDYAGPFGKSDRALVLGLVSVGFATGFIGPAIGAFVFPVFCFLSLATIFNRIKAISRPDISQAGAGALSLIHI